MPRRQRAGHGLRRPSARYRRLLGYLLRNKAGWVGILVLTLLSTGLGLLEPWPLKVLVDDVLGHRPLTGPLGSLPGAGSTHGLLAWVVVAGLVIFAAAIAADLLLTLLWIRVGQRMVWDLGADLFARLQRRSLLFHARRPVADSLSRVTDDAWCLHTVVDDLLFTPGHALIVVAGLVAVMLHLDVALTVVAVATAPLMVAASLLLGDRARTAGRQQRLVESTIQTHIQQTLAGLPVVQAFGQEDRQRRRLQELAGRAIHWEKRAALVSALNCLGSDLVGTLGAGVILLVGSYRVLHGELTLGTLLVFVAYLTSLQTQLRAITSVYGKLQSTRGRIERVMEILETDPEVEDPAEPLIIERARGAVRFEHVSFGYEPDRPVLHDVSLDIRPGELVAIVGATGAGKSTLAGLVPRFFDPVAGRVLVDGIDVRRIALRQVRAQVGIVLQEPFLLPTTVAANIAQGRPSASAGDIESAARTASAHEFIGQLPDGYDTVIGERGMTLSGGERQRIAIARALLKDAPILILDEPTSALDAQTEVDLLEALERLMKGRTTLIIAHRLSTVRGADRIVVLGSGRVLEAGTHDELVAAGGMYAGLQRLQASTTPAVIEAGVPA